MQQIFLTGCRNATHCGIREDHFEGVGASVRLVLVAAILVVVFLVIRKAVVPAGIGKYGHYRAGALDDVRARAVSFAGRQACEACHSEVVQTKSQGKHAQVGCEACHGPLAGHAGDPGEPGGEARPGHALRAVSRGGFGKAERLSASDFERACGRDVLWRVSQPTSSGHIRTETESWS